MRQLKGEVWGYLQRRVLDVLNLPLEDESWIVTNPRFLDDEVLDF